VRARGKRDGFGDAKGIKRHGSSFGGSRRRNIVYDVLPASHGIITASHQPSDHHASSEAAFTFMYIHKGGLASEALSNASRMYCKTCNS